jgi:hypothetical protein
MASVSLPRYRNEMSQHCRQCKTFMTPVGIGRRPVFCSGRCRVAWFRRLRKAAGPRINSRCPNAARGDDAYFTPPCAVHSLMALETLPTSIVDPCCGNGAILEVLEAAGHIVHGSDIVDHGWRPGCTVIRDYLAGPIEMGAVAIVSNPPYKLAVEFIKKAVADGCTYHAWLLRTNFLESVSRKVFFEPHPPSRIWISSARLPRMHRLGWVGKRSGSNVSYAWYIWDATAPRGPMVGWFDWHEHEKAARN